MALSVLVLSSLGHLEIGEVILTILGVIFVKYVHIRNVQLMLDIRMLWGIVSIYR